MTTAKRYLTLALITLLAAGCATTEQTDAPSARSAQADAVIEDAPVGSHIRGRKKKGVVGTTKMNGEAASQALRADPMHATGEQIINARNEGR